MRTENNIKIEITASPVYSLPLFCIGTEILMTLSVYGISDGATHNISVNLYGLSRSGFFLEKTSFDIGEYHCSDIGNTDCESFSFAGCFDRMNIRREFFASLKNAVTGKISAEVYIDGQKYMGDTPILLLPANVYPKSAGPAMIPSLLEPFEQNIVSIAKDADSLASLYNEIHQRNIIYSVRECEFLSKDTAYDRPEAILSKHSGMATSLEMLIIFLSSALCAGLDPCVIAIKQRKTPRVFCGVCDTGLFGGAVCCRSADINAYIKCGKIKVFDISDLFTGHTIDFEDACRNAEFELLSQTPSFALDVCAGLRDVNEFVYSYDADKEKALLLKHSAAKKSADRKSNRNMLSVFAEKLSDTNGNALLDFAVKDGFSIPLCFSDEKSVSDIAKKKSAALISVYDKIDMKKNASGAGDYFSMFIGETHKKELTNTEKNDVSADMINFRDIICDCEARGYACLLENAEYIPEKEKFIRFGFCENAGELYLAYGFLKYNGKYAPIALYPVKLESKNGTSHIIFLSSKPYHNRLLAEYVNSLPQASRFFDTFGMPQNDISGIISCYEKLCEKYPDRFELIKESFLSYFPYQNSTLSFELIDKCEKLISDRLSGAVITGEKDAYFKNSAPVSFEDAAYAKAISAFESEAPGQFGYDSIRSAVFASDGDCMMSGLDSASVYEAATASAVKNMMDGIGTSVIVPNAYAAEKLVCELEKYGLSDFALALTSNADIKELIKEKLILLSKKDLPTAFSENTAEADGYIELRKKLDAYDASKNRSFDFDFSFHEAAHAFINAGAGLDDGERNIILTPDDNLFLPDMKKESVAALFEAGISLCRSMAVVSKAAPSVPYGKNPLRFIKTKDRTVDKNLVTALCDNCICGMNSLSDACKAFAAECGTELSDIRSLTALYAYLSLLVLISNEYKEDMPEKLLRSDIYAISKDMASLKKLASEILIADTRFAAFESTVFDIDCETLFDSWTSGNATAKAYVSKTLGEFAKSGSVAKSDIPDILERLCERKRLKGEFDAVSENAKEAFGECFRGIETDWDALEKHISFAKMADVLLKKIYGTDTEQRHAASENIAVAAKIIKNKANLSVIIEAAGTFDRLFADDGDFTVLSKQLSADVYNMNFENGLFSDDGIGNVLSCWKENVAMLPQTAAYNECAEKCSSLGIGCFAEYFRDNAYTPSSQAIFTRSILHLALNQMMLADKRFMAYPGYEEDTAELSRLHTARFESNKAKLLAGQIKFCGEYIEENKEKSKAFSESLFDAAYSNEDVLLRYGEIIKAMFPIIIAEPCFARLMSGYHSAIYAFAGTVPCEMALPVMHTSQKKLILCEKTVLSGSLAEKCAFAGIPTVSAREISEKCDGRISGYPEGPECCLTSENDICISYIRVPVSSYDKEKDTNVLEAQAIGLELIKLFENGKGNGTFGIVSLKENQNSAVKEVLRVISEKNADIADAVRSGRIRAVYADSLSCSGALFDTCFISTVYGKDEASGTCSACGEFDTVSSDSVPESINRALSCAAKRLYVAGSDDGGTYPEKVGVHGLLHIARLCEFAKAGKNIYRAFTEHTHGSYASEFCKLMDEIGCPSRILCGGMAVSVDIGGKKTAAVFEKESCLAAYSRECSLCGSLSALGYETLRINSVDIALNPKKIKDEITKRRDVQ